MRLTFALLVAALLLLGLATAWGVQSGERDALHVVLDVPVPSAPSPAFNVRFASDDSVYLLRARHGVEEVALDDQLTLRRRAIPDAKTMDVTRYDRLAVSGRYLAAARGFKTFVWRDLRPGPNTLIIRLPAGITDAMDLSANRLLLLGVPSGDLEPGGVVWLGPLDKQNLAKGLRPILKDAGGAGSPNLVRCGTFRLGGARFLPDGSFVVAPGFQPGIHHFSAAGRLLRTWDSKALGVDDACGELTQEQGMHLLARPQQRYEFLSQHAVIDEILPFAEGPGLVIRTTGADGRLHWALKILESGERVLTYQLPITGTPPWDRLEGDAKGNRMVVLVTNAAKELLPTPPARLMVLDLPAGTQPQEGR